jgi:UDP-3-O-[3-hydroxymyristoyl] glucosamine N-acyltransferase
MSNTVIGKNTYLDNQIHIAHNNIIGDKCIIAGQVGFAGSTNLGNNVMIGGQAGISGHLKIGNNVHVLDGCVIGKKGFGFFPKQGKNIRYPHIGIVIINDNVEIGCGSTIDRGSMSNTIIGANTFLDNQIHIAHNNIIGDNCIIAGQVGLAGSSTLGKNVMIGGQAGISGHLKIGNNVKIAGGSGVIKNIPDNSRVMGYPAKDLKNFIKANR